MKTQKLNVRGFEYHVQQWGEPTSPKLIMLHGWMDCGASFKFMMPILAKHFHVIAPDLRGFGETQHAENGYWFPDYLADLEVLINHYAGDEMVDLAGHSMGGNIVLMYAGLRPNKVRRVLSLEGLGLPDSEPSTAPNKYRQWMQQILSDEPSKVYPNANLLKHSIYKGNPTLADEMIEELAVLWAKPVGTDGAVMLKHDHKHRYANPIRYNGDDILAIWSEVQAKAGLVMAADSSHYKMFSESKRIEQAQKALKIAPEHYYIVENCHHMMHLEQADETANCILDFFGN